MTSELNDQSLSFENTDLMDIDPSKSTLALDTMKEWTKGFVLVNEIILKLNENTYEEDFLDNNGNTRTKVKIHPMLLSFMKERRVLMDQYWKISGGEAVNEVKKEVSKQLASTIFNFKQNKKSNDKYRKNVIEILETEAEHNFEKNANER